MIGNSYRYGSHGYTILEQGEINRQTLQLDVSAWLVCAANGNELGSYPSLAAAQQAIDQFQSQL